VSVTILCVGAAATFGASWPTVLLMYFAVVSVALAAIDIEHRRLPHRLVIPSIAVIALGVLVGDLVSSEISLPVGAAGLFILGGMYGILWLVYPKGMGFGDVTTAALCGLLLGSFGWASLAVGAISGPVLAGLVVVGAMLLGRTRRGDAVPFGPFLLAGTWLGILAGPAIAEWYLETVGVAA
jgi:leader peptidase (prepilin peptidase)/N-methyltransferase